MTHDSDRFRIMVEHSQDWFWEFDAHANFTYASPRIKSLLGYEPEEIIGLNAFDLMDEEEAARVRAHFDPIAQKYQPFNNLVNVNRHKDGREVVLESSGTPFFDAQGRFCGYRGIDRDITERMNIERTLRDNQQRLTAALEEAGRVETALKELDRMRNEFVTAAAHELNTPVCAILGYTELLLEPQFSDHFSAAEKQAFLQEIYERGETLNRFIEDLLDVSRIECSQQLPLHRQATNLPEFLRKQADYFGAHHKKHAFDFELPVAAQRPEFVFDPRRIRQVVDNLISNAIKYSPAGSDILLRGEELEDGWEITVADSGIGMTEEQVARIFEKFYRADATDTAISGLGLGMSIARQIVELHGGRIRVASALGHGTSVTVFLPFEPPVPAP